ncbi:MAG: TolC family protein [Gammaproteobacteria bacterium]|nr:TolC family protein [Gammaproteobacteria bacterium]
MSAPAIANPRRRALLATATAVLISALPAAGIAAGGLTLEQAMQAALTGNQALRAARSEIEAARARLGQAGLLPNPRLDVSAESDRLFGHEGEYAYGLGLSQDIPVAGRLDREKDVAGVDLALAEAGWREAERQLLARVAGAFYGLVVRERQLALRDRLIALAGSLVEAARARAGEVSALDANAAALERERLRLERTALMAARDVALAELAAAMGRSVRELPAVDTALPPVAAPPPLAALLESGLRRRPDLRSAALGADRARAERHLAGATAWEDWSLSLGVQQERLVVDGAPPQAAGRLLMLSLSIPLPLFNRNRGAIAAAVADEDGARARLAALRQAFENEVVGLYGQAEQLRTALAEYGASGLPLSRQNTELARLAYRRGEAAMTEVIQAERQERELHASHLELLEQYLQARAALDAATMSFPVGGPPAEPWATPDQGGR